MAQGHISAYSASVFWPYENILTPVALHQIINFGLLPVKTVLWIFLPDFCEQEQLGGKGGEGKQSPSNGSPDLCVCVAGLRPRVTVFLPWDLLHLTLNGVMVSENIFFSLLGKLMGVLNKRWMPVEVLEPAGRWSRVPFALCVCLYKERKWLLSFRKDRPTKVTGSAVSR